MSAIDYPYLPTGRIIKYVDAHNPFMLEAREHARKYSLDDTVKTGSVVVKNGEIIGWGANGNSYHTEHGCERVKRGTPTGHGYELCPGCDPKDHSEPRAIADALKNGHETTHADLYLWGHWWACESCWRAVIEAGIKGVYLLKDSEKFFNKAHSDNVIGRQFT